MIRLILFLLIFIKSVNACALCAVYSPRTDVSIHLKADKQFIKTAKVKWTFASAFSKELLNLYDVNLDNNLDNEELKVIENSLIDYIKPLDFLTKIYYGKDLEKSPQKVEIKNYKMHYKSSVLFFEYELNLNYKIANNNKLKIKIHDDGAFFFIIFDNKKQLFNIPYLVEKQYKPNSITYTLIVPKVLKDANNKKLVKEENKTESKLDNEEVLIENLTKEENKKELTLLEKYTKSIKQYLINIEKGQDKLSLFFLLIASFFYGVIHALGPGHGKALAFSYFSSQKSSYFQAFNISLLTAFIHILGAFVLVVVSVFILQSVLNNFIEDSIRYLTGLSAVLIMLLSIYILYRKLKKKSCACCACDSHNPKLNFTTNSDSLNFVQKTNNKPKIDFSNTKDRKRQDLFFVLTAGLIPCPGTVLLFVYAFILQTYFSVILASIAISLGMGIVIFASSFLGLSLNKVSSKSHKFTNFLEIFAPIFMFILGVLLLVSIMI